MAPLVRKLGMRTCGVRRGAAEEGTIIGVSIYRFSLFLRLRLGHGGAWYRAAGRVARRAVVREADDADEHGEHAQADDAHREPQVPG